MKTVIKVQPKKIYWIFIYPLTTVAFILLSVLFILSARGYNIHFENGRPEFKKTGMFIVSSKPAGVDVLLDGKHVSRKTNGLFSTKITRLSQGKYTLSLEKEGFYSWTKELEIYPEMVTWANYVLLFSKNPDVEKINLEGSLVQRFSSADRKADLILTKSPTGELLYRVSNDSGEIAVVLETDKLGADKKVSGIRILDWSKDRRNILISAVLAGETKYWNVNADSHNVEDLSVLSPVKYDKLMFNTGNSDELYGLFQGNLRRINLKTREVTGILEKNIGYFTFSLDGKIYYIQNKGKARALYSANGDLFGKTEISDNLPVSESYEIKVSDKEQKVALKVKEDLTLYVVAKVNEKNSLISMGKNVSEFLWSPEGDKLFYKKEKMPIVFEDKEYKKESKEYRFTESDNFKNITWYDNYHLLAEENGKVKVIDFDGTNEVILGSSLKDTGVFYNPDHGNIYFFSGADKDKTILSKYKTGF